MTRLSVNINKIATLRNARGGNNPDVVKVALDLERYGAEGITVHPRPDERHIRWDDVMNLKDVLHTEFNMEGYPDERFMDLAEKARPAQVTLVPDSPTQITSNSGWDTKRNEDMLRERVRLLKEMGCRVSIFVDANEEMVAHARKTGADRVELYTEPYASGYDADRRKAIEPFIAAARKAREVGLGLNAGHDLSLRNLAFFHEAIPWLDEVSIGHALICDALYLGLEKTVRAYLDCLK